MQEIIREMFMDFQKYNGKSFILLLMLACLLFLWIVEKDKRIKTIFVYLVTALLLVFICPLYGLIAKSIDSEIYYRVLWTIPIGVLFCYSIVKLLSIVKKPFSKVLIFILALAIIMLNGDFVYTKTLHFKSVNKYHVPEVVLHISDFLSLENYIPTATLPAELLPFIRMYSADIYTEYGRNILETQWDFSHELYDAMEAPQYDTALIAEHAKKAISFFVVLSSLKPQIGSMEEQGYAYLGMCDGYYVYFDRAIYEDIAKQGLFTQEETMRFEKAMRNES